MAHEHSAGIGARFALVAHPTFDSDTELDLQLRHSKVRCRYQRHGHYPARVDDKVHAASHHGWCHWRAWLESISHACSRLTLFSDLRRRRLGHDCKRLEDHHAAVYCIRPPRGWSLCRSLWYASFVHCFAARLTFWTGLAAGFTIGIVGDAGVRGVAQQPRLFVGMVLILIFAEVLGIYGLIVALIMKTATNGVSDAVSFPGRSHSHNLCPSWPTTARPLSHSFERRFVVPIPEFDYHGRASAANPVVSLLPHLHCSTCRCVLRQKLTYFGSSARRPHRARCFSSLGGRRSTK